MTDNEESGALALLAKLSASTDEGQTRAYVITICIIPGHTTDVFCVEHSLETYGTPGQTGAT